MSNITTSKRARLGPGPGALETVLGPNECENLMQPLWKTKGMIWPYTPVISLGGTANYGNFHFTHSNFQHYQYQNSAPLPIQITGTFTAQTNEEARYMLAVLRFLRASTMIEFGLDAARRGVAGTPPPVLRFNYLGSHMINNVPVVLESYNYILEDGIDYVEVTMPGQSAKKNFVKQAKDSVRRSVFGEEVITKDNRTYVPTSIVITTMLTVQQNPRNTRENFDLDAFKRGDLINKGFI